MLDYCSQSPSVRRVVSENPSAKFRAHDHHVELLPYVRRVYEEGRKKFSIIYTTSPEPLPSNASVKLYGSALEMNRSLMPEKSKHCRTIAIVGAICDRDPLARRYVSRYGRLADGLDYMLRYHNSSSLALQVLEAGMFEVLEENSGLIEKIIDWKGIGYEIAGDFVVVGRPRPKKLPLNWTNKVLDHLIRKTGCRYAIGYQLYGKKLWNVIIKKDWLSGESFGPEFVDKFKRLLRRPGPRGLAGSLAQKDPDTLMTWVPTKEDAVALVNEITQVE